MLMRMISDIFQPKLEVSETEDWVDIELKRLADDLEVKRQKAIEFLGDKWILLGGAYTRSNATLGQK